MAYKGNDSYLLVDAVSLIYVKKSHLFSAMLTVAVPHATSFPPCTFTVSHNVHCHSKHERKRRNLHRSAVIEYYDRAVSVCTTDGPNAAGNKELVRACLPALFSLPVLILKMLGRQNAVYLHRGVI